MSLRPCLTPSSMQYSDIYIHHTPHPHPHTPHTTPHTTPTPHPHTHTHTPHPHTLFTSIFTLAVTPYPAF
ncbi:BDC_1c_G0047770.mRNA.1.CDS.1 [Saccharomyces cerevisiae]|nr:BDC_1c_G0047770.mRNA.1.CDS.1 [Saccharomyces cerevisiae]CAI7328229.1 BDC_1c_G0047770.mRNA.1.CDS.1 [Saccharomyces cerevisiae]